ncbi:TPA: protein YidI [Escherichia coli]
MGIIAQNKISSLGMLFGAIALMMGIIHFSFGPFSAPPPTLESIVADKTAEIKRGLLAGIKGEKITTVERKEDVDVDKILDQSGIALAIAALLCAFIGGMRKENRWGIRGALVFGGRTLAFHTLLFGIGIVCSILLIFLIFSFLTGGSLV